MTIDVAASPTRIYNLVSDLPRMGEWGLECRQVEWIEGATGPAVGARFVGHNRDFGGFMGWSRRGTVRVTDPGSEFSFATEEGGREGTVWRYRIEGVDGGTRVTESYEVEWIPAIARVVDVPTNRAGSLRRGMTRFGAVLADVPIDTTDIPPADLRAGQVFWTTVDSAWLHQADRDILAANIEATRRIEPQMVFSSHLPAAPGHLLPALLEAITAVPDAPQFAGPDQTALEQMLATS